MNAKFPLKQSSCPCIWLAALVLALLLARIQAQDPFPSPTPPPDPLAGVPVQVLDQQQITIDAHTVTYHRIAPPVFPARTPTPAPPARLNTNSVNHHAPPARSPHPNDLGDSGEKSSKTLFLSATVYDHQFTEVRWHDGTGVALRAYVNIDFCYFTTVTSLETADTVYDLFFAWSDDKSASLAQAGQLPPDLSSVPPGQSGYQVIAGDPNANADAISALNALCAYYDANSAQMIASFNQQQANNAAHQQWLLDHPPVQPNTVINYWPVKSRVYLPAGH